MRVFKSDSVRGLDEVQIIYELGDLTDRHKPARGSGGCTVRTYLIKGTITDTCGTTNQKWLESGFLQKLACIWKIVFMHSTRVPTLPQENRGEIK
jgi:hypothetical protein